MPEQNMLHFISCTCTCTKEFIIATTVYSLFTCSVFTCYAHFAVQGSIVLETAQIKILFTQESIVMTSSINIVNRPSCIGFIVVSMFQNRLNIHREIDP